MSTTSWIAGVSGNWNNAGFWTSGRPNSSTTAFIQAPGDYTVTLGGTAVTDTVVLNAVGATLSEKSAGSLTANFLDVENGVAILRGTNTIGAIDITGGTLEFSNGGALGAAGIDVEGGALVGLGTATVTNALTMSGDSSDEIAAAHGKTLTIGGGGWVVDASSFFTLTFGDSTNDGTIKFVGGGTESVVNAGNYTVRIEGGALLGTGDGALAFMLGSANRISIGAGTTLDIGGNDTSVGGLSGAGTITNSGPLKTFTVNVGVGFGQFSGVISGPVNVTFAGSGNFSFAAHQTFTGALTIGTNVALQVGFPGSDTDAWIDGNVVVNGLLGLFNAADETAGQSVSGSGTLQVGLFGHTLTIHRAETLSGGLRIREQTTLDIDRASAVGSGTLYLNEGGMVRASADVKLTNALYLGQAGWGAGDVGFSATAGHTLNLHPATGWTLDTADTSRIHFGSATDTGTVIWYNGGGASVINGGAYNVSVDGGTLKGADSLGSLLGSTGTITTVAAGATVDLNGFFATVVDLEGAGTVTTTGGNAPLIVDIGTFSGVITNKVSVDVLTQLTLTGNNTYSGGTTIENGAVLLLGSGGNNGSITGNIVDNGTLIIDRGDAVAVTQAISGSGLVMQAGDGTTTIDRAETYAGGTIVASGELSIDRAAAIGAGQLTLTGGELLTTGNVTLVNTMSMSGDFTIAAAHGTTSNFNGNFGWGFDSTGGASITFGEDGNDGTVVWHVPGGSSVNGTNYQVNVAHGTLRAGDASLGTLLSPAQATTIDAGATLDFHGFNGAVTNLHGDGVLKSTGGLVNIDGGNFAGAINGGMTIAIFDNVTLSGGGTVSNAFLESSATLTLDNDAHEDISFAGGGATIVFDNPAGYDGTVSGFAASDALDLTTIDSGSVTLHYKPSTGVLTATDGTHTAHITLAGSYSLSDFSTSDDGSGGTDIIIFV